MKRGELWTLKDRSYAAKARPVVIVQADLENDFDSVILCLFTTFESENISTRVKIDPTSENGLEKTMLGRHIGNLANDEMHLIAGKLAKILEIHKNDIEE